LKERSQRQLEEKFEAEYKALETAFVEELGAGIVRRVSLIKSGLLPANTVPFKIKEQGVDMARRVTVIRAMEIPLAGGFQGDLTTFLSK
jgi:hypothetical protein